MRVSLMVIIKGCPLVMPRVSIYMMPLILLAVLIFSPAGFKLILIGSKSSLNVKSCSVQNPLSRLIFVKYLILDLFILILKSTSKYIRPLSYALWCRVHKQTPLLMSSVPSLWAWGIIWAASTKFRPMPHIAHLKL